MTVYPYLLNNGFQNYSQIINPYPPVMTFILSKITLMFGYSISVYKSLTWIVILGIDLSIYYVSFKITKRISYAILSLLCFIAASIPFGINSLWFDLVQTPFTLFSILFFINFLRSNKPSNLLLSGLFISIGIFIKQSMAIVLLPYIILLILQKKDFKKIFLILIPSLILFLFHILLFSLNGQFDDYIDWNIIFPLIGSSNLPGYLSLPNFKQWIILASLITFFSPLLFVKKNVYKYLLFIVVFLYAFIFPRFGYFHLIPVLASTSLLAGPILKKIKTLKLPYLLLPLLSFMILIIFFANQYKTTYGSEVRFLDKNILTAADYLKTLNIPNAEIYILNGPDQLLPLTGLLPIKPWADEFPWYLERGTLQSEILTSLKKANPKYIIYKPYESGGTYSLGAYKPKLISKYIEENYQNITQISDTLWLKEKI